MVLGEWKGGDRSVGAEPCSEDSSGSEHIRTISDNLVATMRRNVEWHGKFVDDWFAWANQTLAQWQPVPPQAHADLHRELQRMLDHLRELQPTAAALKALGHADLDQLLTGTQKHVEDAQQSFTSMSNSMARGAANAAESISSTIKRTHDFTSEVFRDLHEQRVAGADQAHKDFMRNLRS